MKLNILMFQKDNNNEKNNPTFTSIHFSIRPNR